MLGWAAVSDRALRLTEGLPFQVQDLRFVKRHGLETDAEPGLPVDRIVEERTKRPFYYFPPIALLPVPSSRMECGNWLPLFPSDRQDADGWGRRLTIAPGPADGPPKCAKKFGPLNDFPDGAGPTDIRPAFAVASRRLPG